jgi:prepilin signal peptidase PulO-like enzyme (type II secretory pathway)
MGYGDFKLLAALGAWMGPLLLPLIVLLSSFVGAIIGIILLKVVKKISLLLLVHILPSQDGLPFVG